MKKIILLMIVCYFSQTILAQESSGETSKIENTSKISQTASATSTVVMYDFTTSASKYYGGALGAAILEINGADTTWGMIAGDANGDGGIYSQDYAAYKSNQGAEGYFSSDFNMDGGVYTQDYAIYKNNQGLETQVP